MRRRYGRRRRRSNISGAPRHRQRLWPRERRALALARLPGDAAGQVVVDQSHRLHEGVHGGRSDETPAALLEVAGERLRVVITPDEVGEGLLLGELDRPLRVVDRRLDLPAVADYRGVLQEAFDIVVGEARDAMEVEALERRAERLALA